MGERIKGKEKERNPMSMNGSGILYNNENEINYNYTTHFTINESQTLKLSEKKSVKFHIKFKFTLQLNIALSRNLYVW